MADRPQVPNWNVINLNKPNEYSSEFVVDGSRYANVTDVSTGQRWLYSVGPLGTRNLISSTSADGTVTKGSAYDSVASQYDALNTANKNQSIFIIDQVSTDAEKSRIGATAEYKNTFGLGAGGGPGSNPFNEALQDFQTTELRNPIIPIGSYVKYPEIMSVNQDRIYFTACAIRPRDGFVGGPGSGGGGFSLAKKEYIQAAGTVVMSMQAPIQDQNGAEWSQESLSAIDALVYNAAASLIPGAGGNGKGIEGVVDEFVKSMEEGVAKGRLQRYFAGQAAGQNNILSRTDGIVLNPNLELLFQGPQLRPFTFTFKMAARDPKEANAIKKIIKYFKRHMAPTLEEDELFLKAPHVFTIQYMKGGDGSIKQWVPIKHPSISMISDSFTTKACALTNCSVDYTPLGSYSTYNDPEATMTAYTISLQFQEITPIYSKDYEVAHPIGF
jgi:hypothetical protein